MTDKHRRFIHLENIRNFEKRLETETDPKKIDMLTRLLEEEKAKWLAPIESQKASISSR